MFRQASRSTVCPVGSSSARQMKIRWRTAGRGLLFHCLDPVALLEVEHDGIAPVTVAVAAVAVAVLVAVAVAVAIAVTVAVAVTGVLLVDFRTGEKCEKCEKCDEDDEDDKGHKDEVNTKS